jgi:uncharacterized ion transporter superfamily protein YfcC
VGTWNLAVVAGVILAYGALSGWLRTTVVSSAMVFVTAGLVLGPSGLGWFDADMTGDALRVIAEIALTFILFADASRIDLRALRRDYPVPARLLGIGLPLTIVAGTLVARAVWPGLPWVEAAVLAVILAPTDAALGQAVVTDPRLPQRISQGLNVESGLNDGICVPLLFILLAAAGTEEEHVGGAGAVHIVVEEIGFGALGGVVAALVGVAAIHWGTTRAGMSPRWAARAALVTAALAYGLAAPIGGSGFIAAFVGGMVFALFRDRLVEGWSSLIDGAGALFDALTFFAFGAAVLGPLVREVDGWTVLYAVLSLTLVRMVPVAISFVRSHARLPTIGFVGWFGPRGLASIVFVVLVLDEGQLAHARLIAVVAATTIALSVYAHGLSALPLTERYRRWYDARPRPTSGGGSTRLNHPQENVRETADDRTVSHLKSPSSGDVRGSWPADDGADGPAGNRAVPAPGGQGEPAVTVTEQDAEPAGGGDAPEPPADPTDGGRRAFRFPTALTVLALVLLIVWLASFFIPSGRYQLDAETRGPVPGTYHELPICSTDERQPCVDKSLAAQVRLLWRAPPNGLYGVESTESGYVSADEEGVLYGSAQIFLFVLIVGAFITMAMKTGAIETGIGRLALRFRRSPAVLVGVLMGVFALGGTSYGMWEETLGFFVLLVPLVMALRYDRMVAVSIIFLGAGSGVIASTVNPFATGVASDAAGISISDGLGVRVVLLLEGHAAEVGADAGEVADVPRLTSRQKLTLAVFFGAFAVMIYGFIPWDDLWTTFFSREFPLPTFASFYFTEASMLFLVATIVVGIIAKLGEEGTVNTIVAGASDFLGAALVIVAARGITVVMKNTYITDTILHWMEDWVSGRTAGGFAVLTFVVNLPIAFLVPSSSGHAALVMPIIAPLADFAGVSRAVTVTGFQTASGFINLLTPTSAVIMGGLTLAKVRYDRYLRFLAPFLLVVFVVVILAMVVSASVGSV